MISRSFDDVLCGDNFLFLARLDSPQSKDTSRKSRQILQVSLCLPKGDNATSEVVGRLKDSVYRQLSDLMPFSGQSIIFLGQDIRLSPPDSLSSLFSPKVFSKARKRSRHESGFHTGPVRNLFFLPDEGHYPATHLWQGRAAVELAEHLLERP